MTVDVRPPGAEGAVAAPEATDARVCRTGGQSAGRNRVAVRQAHVVTTGAPAAPGVAVELTVEMLLGWAGVRPISQPTDTASAAMRKTDNLRMDNQLSTAPPLRRKCRSEHAGQSRECNWDYEFVSVQLRGAAKLLTMLPSTLQT